MSHEKKYFNVGVITFITPFVLNYCQPTTSKPLIDHPKRISEQVGFEQARYQIEGIHHGESFLYIAPYVQKVDTIAHQLIIDSNLKPNEYNIELYNEIIFQINRKKFENVQVTDPGVQQYIEAAAALRTLATIWDHQHSYDQENNPVQSFESFMLTDKQIEGTMKILRDAGTESDPPLNTYQDYLRLLYDLYELELEKEYTDTTTTISIY